MCKIEEVKGYRLGGKLYDTPSAAVNAGLLDIASDIQRNHSNAVLPGLRKHRAALLYLLAEDEKHNPNPAETARKDPPADATDDNSYSGPSIDSAPRLEN